MGNPHKRKKLRKLEAAKNLQISKNSVVEEIPNVLVTGEQLVAEVVKVEEPVEEVKPKKKKSVE